MRGSIFRGSIGVVGVLIVGTAMGTACSSSSSGNGNAKDAGSAPAAGGTGAFGIVTVNGMQKLYLPQESGDPTTGNGYISVVNVGVAGNGVAGAPALITNIDLGTSDYATATGGDSSTVIAASTDANKIWFINPQNDTLTKTITLDPSYGRSGFSGGGGYVTGIAVDSANHRAILSVWNGFAIVDLNSQTISSVIQAPPSENFGFDSVHQRIIAPFYDCSTSLDGTGAAPPFCNQFFGPDGTTVMSEGVNIIDLADNTVYTYEDPSADDPNTPVGGEPDSASADPTTQKIVVPSESGGYQNIIDLSNAQFDKTKKTVTAPHAYVQNLDLEGVAIESNKHFAFWEEEGSQNVAVADLGSVAVDGGSNTPTATMPDLPNSGGSWSNLGDPHGIAVTTGLADGHSVGFVVDGSRHWVARVDLEKMSQLQATDAGDGIPSGVTSDQMATVVTFLDATTKP